MKLQLFLSHNGVCSRRKALDLIQSGQVTVNGEVILEPSTQIDPLKDLVAANGRSVQQHSFEYVVFNKPKGAITSKSDPHAAMTVFDLLPKHFQHLQAAGRLDQDTEGLLLFTNDGDAAFKLTHPKFNVDKVYFVRILGRLSTDAGKQIERGVMIDGEKTSPAKIRNLVEKNNQTELLLTIHEGKKRQVRRMFEAVGSRVSYLKRLSQGPLELGDLKPGQWRRLNKREIESIKNIQ